MAYRPPVPVSASGSVSGSSSSSGLHFFNSPFGDTTHTKVFVGGLAWETHSETLQRHFEQFGDILEAVVISDKNSGRSKGYGFVTFRHPESASRACADPSPIIDGRRANCNLASLGRHRPAPHYAHLSPSSPYVGGVPIPRGAYTGGSTYHQVLPYNYPISFPSVGYTAYGPEYAYPQNVYSPLISQQFVQVYGVPGAANTAIYPYGQLSQPISIAQGFTTMQGYTMPLRSFVQPGGPGVSGLTASPRPANQVSYPTVDQIMVEAESIRENTFRYPLDCNRTKNSSATIRVACLSCLATYLLCILEIYLVFIAREHYSIQLLQRMELKAHETRCSHLVRYL